MNVSYTKIGDYLLPDLKLKEEKQYNIGKYGLLKLRYLKEYKKGLYTELLMKEQLNSYLYEFENLVKEKVNELIISLAEKENVNEKLKNDNQMLWTGLMNNIKKCAEEIVFREYFMIKWSFFDVFWRKNLMILKSIIPTILN